MAHAAGASFGAARHGKTRPCVVLTGRDSVMPGNVLVDLQDKIGHGPNGGARTLPIARCEAATAATASGIVWAWVRPKPRTLALQAYRCKSVTPKGVNKGATKSK